MIDEIDQELIRLLQEDARLSNAELGNMVGLTGSSVYERVKKLQKKGVIKRYVALTDAQMLGKPITAFVRLTIGGQLGQSYRVAKKHFFDACLAEPDVVECHSVAGEDCVVLKVRAASPPDLEKMLERLRAHSLVTRTVTSLVLSTLKESTAIAPALPVESSGRLQPLEILQ